MMEEPTPVPLGNCLRALSHPSRREVVARLLDAESETVTVDRLVGGDRDERIRFRHQHLPRLAQAGHIEWDRDGGTVGPGPAFDELGRLLETLRANESELFWELE